MPFDFNVYNVNWHSRMCCAYTTRYLYKLKIRVECFECLSVSQYIYFSCALYPPIPHTISILDIFRLKAKVKEIYFPFRKHGNGQTKRKTKKNWVKLEKNGLRATEKKWKFFAYKGTKYWSWCAITENIACIWPILGVFFLRSFVILYVYYLKIIEYTNICVYASTNVIFLEGFIVVHSIANRNLISI